MKKIIFYLLGIAMTSIFSSCEKEVIRGTQTPKNVIEVPKVGKIGQMTKYYDFSDRFLSCWDYGFSCNEAFGRWCIGEKGVLIFQVRKNATVTMKLDFVAFIADSHKECKVKLVASGVDCGEYVLTENKSVFLNLDSRHITKDNAIELDLIPLNPVSPKELGMSDDERKIGFGLKSITLWAYYPVE